MITAVLSALVFEERLTGLWWLGAGMLVAGSVVIGMRDEGEGEGKEGGAGAGEVPLLDGEGAAREEDGDGEDEGRERVGLESVRGRGRSSERGGSRESSDEDGTLR